MGDEERLRHDFGYGMDLDRHALHLSQIREVAGGEVGNIAPLKVTRTAEDYEQGDLKVRLDNIVCHYCGCDGSTPAEERCSEQDCLPLAHRWIQPHAYVLNPLTSADEAPNPDLLISCMRLVHKAMPWAKSVCPKVIQTLGFYFNPDLVPIKCYPIPTGFSDPRDLGGMSIVPSTRSRIWRGVSFQKGTEEWDPANAASSLGVPVGLETAADFFILRKVEDMRAALLAAMNPQGSSPVVDSQLHALDRITVVIKSTMGMVANLNWVTLWKQATTGTTGIYRVAAWTSGGGERNLRTQGIMKAVFMTDFTREQAEQALRQSGAGPWGLVPAATRYAGGKNALSSSF
eukprot:2679043-Amphidinium_carterae.1